MAQVQLIAVRSGVATLQKQPQHRQARYGENFHRAVPPPPLGTDVEALLLMLEAEERQ